MASPKSPATDRVVIFTPAIAGRRTVSVVISSSITDFRNRPIPMSFKMAWETQATIRLAPFFFSNSAAWVKVPADYVKSSTNKKFFPRI